MKALRSLSLTTFLLASLIAFSAAANEELPICGALNINQLDLQNLPPALSQSCRSTEEYLERFSGGDINESPVLFALLSENGGLQLLANQRSKTWTLFLALTDGRSCMLNAGNDYFQSQEEEEMTIHFGGVQTNRNRQPLAGLALNVDEETGDWQMVIYPTIPGSRACIAAEGSDAIIEQPESFQPAVKTRQASWNTNQ